MAPSKTHGPDGPGQTPVGHAVLGGSRPGQGLHAQGHQGRAGKCPNQLLWAWKMTRKTSDKPGGSPDPLVRGAAEGALQRPPQAEPPLLGGSASDQALLGGGGGRVLHHLRLLAAILTASATLEWKTKKLLVLHPILLTLGPASLGMPWISKKPSAPFSVADMVGASWRSVAFSACAVLSSSPKDIVPGNILDDLNLLVVWVGRQGCQDSGPSISRSSLAVANSSTTVQASSGVAGAAKVFGNCTFSLRQNGIRHWHSWFNWP